MLVQVGHAHAHKPSVTHRLLFVDAFPKASSSKLLQDAQKRFKEAKLAMVERFSGDGKSDITLVVWDFGGQKVRGTHGEEVRWLNHRHLDTTFVDK